LLNGESISDAAKRIMLKKFGVKINNIKLKSISLEHVKPRAKAIYSFILMLVKAKTKDKIPLITVNNNKKHIIRSDYNLINSPESRLYLKTFIAHRS